MQYQAPKTPTRTPNQTPNRVGATSAASTSGLSAALQGATLAFQAGSGQKTSNDNRPDPTSPSPGWLRAHSQVDNGAARAAAQAARDHSLSRPRSPTSKRDVSRHGTGGSGQELRFYNRDRDMGGDRDVDHTLLHKASQQLSPLSAGSSLHPGARPGTDGRQTSFIAATLAASRSASPSPQHTGQSFAQSPLTPTQLHSRITRRDSHGADSFLNFSSPGHEAPDLTDTSSIPPANSLISLFESKKDDMDPVKKRDPVPQQKRGSPYPKVQPPTPPRSRSPEVEASRGTRQSTPPRKPKPKPKPASLAEGLTTGTAEGVGRRHSDGQTLGEDKTTGATGLLPVVPTQRRKSQKEDGSKVETREDRNTRPVPPPRRQTEGGDVRGAALQQSKSMAKPSPSADKRLSEPSPPQPGLRPVSRGTEFASPQPKRVLKAPPLQPHIMATKSSSNVKMRKPKSQSHTQNVREPLNDTASEQEDPAVRRLSQVSMSSDDTFVSASSAQSPRAMSPVKDLETDSGGRTDSPHSSLTERPTLPPRASTSQSQSRPSAHSRTTLQVGRPTTHSNNSTPNLALGPLTDAIMAGSLASARLSSTSVSNSQGPPPVPAPRRHGPHNYRLHNPLHMIHPQRTADSLQPNRSGGNKSPHQRTGMLQTLRAPHKSLSDDEDARRHMHKHRKKKLVGGKKHAHQEGSRRRWRDEISTRERRRYEAVWASNRGLFLQPGFAFQHPDNWPRSSPSPSQRRGVEEGGQDHDLATAQQIELGRAKDGTAEADWVVNLVVKDIWSRSRLPEDELAEVWDLVDRKRMGVLGKQEFVVGMWLIDQRLRGRKIPARVSESVWESSRGMGMKVLPVSGKGKGKKGKGENDGRGGFMGGGVSN